MSGVLLASANAPFAARLRAALDGTESGEVHQWAPDSSDTDLLQRAAEARAEVVVLGPVTDEEAALRLCSALDVHHPELSVLLVARPLPATLERALRVGVRGVLDPDADADAIRESVGDALESTRRRLAARRAAEPEVDDGRRRVVVLAAKGGAGKTTVAANLAVALSQRAPGEAVLVDLDLQFGDAATALGLEPEFTLASAEGIGGTGDSAKVKGLLTRHPSTGLYVMCAPLNPVEADDLTAEHIGQVLRLLGEQFRYVVVDTAAGIDEPTLVALDHCTDIVLLTSMDVASIRATRKELEALRMLDMSDRRVHLVVNRANTKVGISLPDVEESLGMAVAVPVPSTRELPMSLNLGTPLVESEPRAAASRSFLDLAHLIVAGAAAQNPSVPAAPDPGSSGSRSWRRRRKEVTA